MPTVSRDAPVRVGLGAVIFGWLMMLLAMGSETAVAESSLILPPGFVVEGTVYRRNGTSVPFIETGVDANDYLFSVPPTESFLNPAQAGVVYTTESLQFIRFYTDGVTSPLGSFIVRPDIIRGLSAAQIRDILALPDMPDSLTIVRIPAGTCILSGVAAPILGDFPANPPAIPTPGPWGSGGVEQSYIIGKTESRDCQNAQFLPATDYVNQQFLGLHALWYEPAAGGGNPGAVAFMLDHLPPATPYGDLYDVYNTLDLLNFGDPRPLRSALAQLSGQNYADLAAIEIKVAQSFSNLLLSRIASVRRLTDDPAGVGPPSQFIDVGGLGEADSGGAPRMWISGSGGIGNLPGDDDDGVYGVDYTTAMAAAGVDYRLASGLVIGAGAGYAHSSLSAGDLSDNGDIESYQAAIYAGYEHGPWYVDGTIGYGYEAGELQRSIRFPGVNRRVSGNPDADAFISAFETGYGFGLDRNLAAIPFARLQVSTVFQDDFSENGRGSIALNVDEEETHSVRSVIGVEFDWTSNPRSEVRALALKLRAGWAHEYADDSSTVTASFAGAPAGSFTVQGAEFGRDSLAIEFYSGLVVNDGMSLFMRYDGDIACEGSAHIFSGGLSVAW